MTEREEAVVELVQRPGVIVQSWQTDLIDTQLDQPRAVRHTITITEPGNAERFGLTTTLTPIDWHHAPDA